MGEDTSDLADGFSKYRVELKALTGVDIQKNEHEYKDLLTIFTELASVWDSLESDMARSRVAEILGGTRGLSGIMSTITNIKDAMGAYNDAMNSAGVALEANDKHMETTEARVEQLKASFQELSADIFDSDFMHGAVDALRSVIEIIDAIADKWGSTVAIMATGGALSGVIGGVRSIVQAMQTLNEAGKALSFINVMQTAFPAITGAISAFKTAMLETGGAVGVFKGAFAGIVSLVTAHPFLAAAAGVGVLLAILSKIPSYAEQANARMEQSIQAYEEAKSDVESITSELSTIDSQISGLKAKGTNLSFIDEGELKRLREAREILQTDLELAKQKEISAALEVADSTISSYNEQFRFGSGIRIGEERYRNVLKNNNGSIDSFYGYEADVSAVLAGVTYYKQIRDELDKTSDSYQENYEYYDGLVKQGENIAYGQLDVLNGLRQNLSIIPEDLRSKDVVDTLDAIAQETDFIWKNLDPAKFKQMQFDRIFDDATFNGIKQGLIDIAKESGNAGISLDTLKESLDPEQYNDLKLALFKNGQFSMEDFVRQINAEAGILDMDTVRQNIVDKWNETHKDIEDDIQSSSENNPINPKLEVDPEFDFEEWMNSLPDWAQLALNDIDVSSMSQSDLEAWYDSLINSTEEATAAMSEFTGELSDLDTIFGSSSSYKLELDNYTNQLQTLADAYQKLQSGDFTISDLLELQQTPGLNALNNYDMTNIGDGIISVMESIIGKSDEASRALLDFRNSTEEVGNSTQTIAEAFDNIKNIGEQKFRDIFNGTASRPVLQKYAQDVAAIMQAASAKGFVDLTNTSSVDSFISRMYELGVVQGEVNENALQGTASLGLFDRMVAAVGGDLKPAGQALRTMGENFASFWRDTFAGDQQAQNKTVDELVSTYQTAFDKVRGIVQGQSTGKSITEADFSSDELKDYTDALEYHNGVLQYNAKRVAEISKAKAEETKQTIAANKAMEQSKYLQNAAQIEKLRASLATATDSEKASINSTIQSLLQQNSQIVDTCNKYNLMTNSINEATSAYQNWLNAQSASQSGEMFDSALSAMRKIDDTLNNETSDSYGRIGNADYQAAVDFIVPDTVDHTDTEAVNSYIDSISHLLTFDDKGQADGLNIEAFCEQAVEAGLMTFDESSEEYQIAGQKTMEDFAKGLGLSLPLVQAMFGEMEEFGGHFDWADEMEKTYGDLAVEANEAAESLRNIEGNEDLKIVLDVSEFEDKATAISTLDETIQQMNDLKAKPGVDASEIEQANSVIQYCVAQKQLLDAPTVMHVDTSQVTGELGHALELLQQFQSAKNQVEMQAAIGADTSEAQAEVEALTAEIQGLSPEIQTKLGLDPTSESTITASITALNPEMIVKAGVDPSLVDEYAAAEHNSSGTVTWDNATGAVDSYAASMKAGYGTVYWSNNTAAVKTTFQATGTVHWVNSGGPNKVNGTAHISGTAYAKGDWGTATGGTTLVGELGQEIVVDPRTGMWYTVGDYGPEFVNIPKGSIVFNHLQSKSLLENGYAIGRATALVTGTAMVTGGIKRTKYTSSSSGASSGSSSSSSRSSSGSSSSYRSNYYSEPVSYNDDEDDYSSSSSDDDEEIEKLDWIEIAIDRIERLIENLGRVAESTFKKLANRLKATDEEIESIAEEIAIQQAGEQRYLEQASSVGLSETLAEKVRNGTIDINEYDKDTQELIDDYKEWYEKALDCADAVDELHENLASLYQDRFDMVETDFDNQLALLEHLTTTYENGMDDIEERGYLMTTKYYEASRKVQQQNIDILNKELAELIQKMSDGMNSGEIQEGSEAWYEMQISINGVKEAIQEANTEIIRLGNSIRNTNWEHFDYLQERISDITREADFLISLMEHSKLFDDRGQFSSTGMATMGVHGQNYNVYMNQADRYAREIERIKKEIESDPANTDLIERREELLDLQRESILNAEDEKEAIVDLVREGIETELAALNDVIDAYKESLDTAKDLYDYQKKLSSQAKNVASIQKQLAAYAGDNSEESRATIQRLNAKLGDAMEKLEETEHDRTIKEQKAMLDNLYSEYESILNERLDNVDALISDMIDTINENASNISDTLISESQDVGYTISDSMRSIWASGGEASSVITKYGDSFLSQMTSVNAVLNGIAANVARMIAASDTTAQEVISTTTATTQPNKAPEKPKATTPTAPAKPAGPSDQDYYGVAFAIWEGIYGWGAGDERVARLKAKGFDAAKVQSIVNSVYSDYMNDRFSKYGISSDLSKYAYNKYLHGGLVKYTGLAQVDGTPTKPESFLDAIDTANLARLTEVMRSNSTLNSSDVHGINGLRKSLGMNGDGDIIYNINIPIDHVSDYNDFMNQMKQDNKFEKFVQSVTIDRVAGRNRLAKNKYSW